MEIKKYNPIFSFKEIIDYINDFKNSFLNSIQERYGRLVYIDLPIISNVECNANNIENKIERTINFDSSFDFSIYEIITNFEYIIRSYSYMYNPNYNEVLLFKYHLISRDKKINESISIDEKIYNFEIRVRDENRNYNFLKENAEFIWQSICKFFNNNKNTKNKFIEKIYFSKTFFNKLKLIKTTENETLDKLIKENEFIAIISNSKYDIENILEIDSVNYDFNNTIIFYVWNKQFMCSQKILSITIRPDWNLIKKQIGYDIENDKKYTGYLFDILKTEKFGITMSFKIYMENIISYALNLKVINELPSKYKAL